MEVQKIASYIGSVIAIALGVLSRTIPPLLNFERDFSIALIVAGLAALGVTVALPAIRQQALREGVHRGMVAAKPADPPTR